MAKKIVRGITDVKTINNQDFDTNNVNDLLSDGQYNYIHRKKGNTEEYHNLTDNIKTISSDNTELLSVTNNNKTTNTATLSPKHDKQKEQLLRSTRDTITITHGTNGTAEKTTVDTNPKKVLQHENLISNSQYVTIEHEQDSSTSKIKTDKLNNTINELNSKIATVDGKIPTIIGARNYLRGTSDKYKTYTGTNYILGYPSTDSDWGKLLEPLRGKTVTLRAYIKNDTDFPVRIQVYYTGGGIYGDLIPAHEEGWSVATGEMPTDLTGANVAYTQPSPTSTGGTIQAKEEKLEIGNIPTDWTPAPEDIYPLLAQKEQVLESTRNTVTIQHGTNGTAEKTTVDTNPKKVLEHENLISDSEYITLDHQTDVNKTHIKTDALKQVLEQLFQAISSIGGRTPVINYFSSPDFSAVQHTIFSGDKRVVTFSFECYNTAETVLTGALKQQLGLYVLQNTSISNSGITISNDGTTMKLINSAPSENIRQHATFTFFYKIDEPGGGGQPGGGSNPK